jgi:hypothetical protein
MPLVSVVIPSRNERFLGKTIEEVLGKARGDVECIAVLDGYWPTPPLPGDPRLHIVHRGAPMGMRPGITAAIGVSRGEFVMKLDGHCMLSEGFDVELAKDCADDWVVVPRRHRLDADAWTCDTSKVVDYHFLSYPLERPEDPHCGLHGQEWNERRRARAEILLDDEMSSQGSCWFTTRAHWDRLLNPLDATNYGTFAQEFQEIGCKTWLSGGAVKINKRAWYAHLFKGKKYGRGYSMSDTRSPEGKAFCNRFWMLDQWKERKHDLRWLIERFSPVPTWPADLDEAFARARKEWG